MKAQPGDLPTGNETADDNARGFSHSERHLGHGSDQRPGVVVLRRGKQLLAQQGQHLGRAGRTVQTKFVRVDHHAFGHDGIYRARDAALAEFERAGLVANQIDLFVVRVCTWVDD